MGVRGLSTFVKNQQERFLIRHKLCNEVVVIDGDNLMHYVNNTSKGLNHAFGGDYQKYAAKVEAFFNDMSKCGITPIVLLDGGSDPSNRKLKTAFSRLTDKLDKTRKLEPSTQHRHTCLPLLSKTTFVEVLRHLQIRHAVCPFEADEPLAALARLLDCAVLSDDTDFFAFGVRCVLLSSLAAEPELQLDGQPYIDCVLFRHDRFMRQYGLKPQLMPLFACLLGNDYISPGVLRAFFRHVPRPYGERRGRPAELRIRGLLAWLRRHTDPQQALDEVMGQIKKEDRPAVLKLVQKSMANYSHHWSTDLLSWLSLPEDILCRAQLTDNSVLPPAEESGDRPMSPSGEFGDQPMSPSGESGDGPMSPAAESDDGPLSSAGESGLVSDDDGSLPPAEESDDVPLLPSEDPSGGLLPSVGESPGGLQLDGEPLPAWLADGLRRGLFTADVINIISGQPLLQEPQVEDPRQPPACVCVEPLLRWTVACLRGERAAAVTLYRRADSGRSVVRRQLAPPAAAAPQPPPLRRVAALAADQRRRAVLTALGQPEELLGAVPEQLHLLTAALGFWRRETNGPITAAHIGALLLTERRSAPGVAPLAAPDPALLSGENTADRRLLHQLAQLQCVLAQAANVNALLGAPLSAVSPARLLAGPLVYNAATQLRRLGLERAADWLPAAELAEWRRGVTNLCRAVDVPPELPPARAAPAPAPAPAPARQRPTPQKASVGSKEGRARSERGSVGQRGDGVRSKAAHRRRPEPQLTGNKFAALLLDSDDAMSDSS